MAADLREERGRALRSVLDREGLAGLIVTHLPNIRYLTGFTGTAAVVAVLPRETVFVSDFRYQTQAEAEVGGAARVEIVPSDVWDRLWRVLAEHAGLPEVGFEADHVTVATAERFAQAPFRGRLRPVAGRVEALRARKHPSEVAAIRAAAALGAEALEAALGTVAVGVSERVVAAALEHELRARGSEWHPFPTIVASGPRSALPHARTASRTLAAGDWLLIDFGAQVDGYCADLTRTFVVGAPPDDRQAAIYQLVREAQLAARAGIRVGMTGREADQLARRVIDARGFADAFGHSLGHGLGLEVHEGPRLSATNGEPLPEGAVVTIEPGIYLPGWGGVRIEDDVHLAAAGAVLLSDGGTDLRVLR